MSITRCCVRSSESHIAPQCLQYHFCYRYYYYYIFRLSFGRRACVTLLKIIDRFFFFFFPDPRHRPLTSAPNSGRSSTPSESVCTYHNNIIRSTSCVRGFVFRRSRTECRRIVFDDGHHRSDRKPLKPNWRAVVNIQRDVSCLSASTWSPRDDDKMSIDNIMLS